MTERSYVLPSETPDGEANRRAALAVMRRFVGDVAEMWDLLEMTGLADAAEALFRQRALIANLSQSVIAARPCHQKAASEAAATQLATKDAQLDGFTVAPKGRWCHCTDATHDLNDPKQAVFRLNGSRECRVALNKRRAEKARKARKAKGAA